MISTVSFWIKAIKEQLKIQASNDLQNDIASKNQAESDLKTLEENQTKMETYGNEWVTAQQESTIIEDMLKALSAQVEEFEQMDVDVDIEVNINEGSAFDEFTPEYHYEL